MRFTAFVVSCFLGLAPAVAQTREQPASPPRSDPSASIQSSIEHLAPMADAELDLVAGGSAVPVQVLTNQTLTAAVSGNTLNADTIQSGAIVFNPEALSGFNGIGNFVLNTGNNNVLQGSLTVTIINAAVP